MGIFDEDIAMIHVILRHVDIVTMGDIEIIMFLRDFIAFLWE